jgi:mono/diheme cytochrome c family protein
MSSLSGRRWISRTFILAGGVSVALLAATHLQGQDGTAKPQATEASIAAGKAVFFEYCSGCHGRRADGRGPQSMNLVPRPQNLRNAQFVKYLTDERAYSSISGGVRGTAMPAFELILAPEKRWQAIHYIRSLTADDQVKLANSPAYQAVASGTGNPVASTPESIAKGRTAFLNYCASCHGARADGQGRLSASLTPSPRNLVAVVSWGEKPFIDYMMDSRLYESITDGVPGTSMAPWISVLNDEERWSIINYLRDEARKEREKTETASK